jgi:hypothetical protein
VGRLLHSVYGDNFTLVRPIFSFANQSYAHRVLKNVFPFFSHAFVVAQNVIEKSFLPDLAVALTPAICSGEALFQRRNPPNEDKPFVAADKQMYVIRHDDVASNCDVEFDGTVGKLNESRMCSP